MNEIERYELREAPAYKFELERRTFFELAGAGLAVLLVAPPGAAQESGGGRRGGGRGSLPQEVSAWLHIGETGKATIFTGKVEVGQNTRTALSQAVADELRIPLDDVDLVMGDTDRVPFDAGTFGSLSTPVMSPQLRRVAATARQALIEMAAQRWNVEVTTLKAAEGQVTELSSGRRIAYGDLTKGQQLSRIVAGEVEVTPAKEWKVAGQSAKKVNGRAMVTGGHRYTTDLRLPGLLHGKVLRPPALGAKLKRVELTKARAMADVVVVHDGEFVGVAAPNAATATKAIQAIEAEWDRTPQVSSPELFSHLEKTGSGAGRGSDVAGSVETAFPAAKTKHESRYTIAYIAHAPLEPRAAVASWENGKLTAWTGTQRPFGVRGELAQAFSIPEARVRVIMPDTGSGYGGKHTGEAALEAARLAKAAGKPVKLIWTREEEFQWAYARPAGVITVRSGVDAEGKLVAWEFHNYNSGGSAIRTLYEVENRRIEFHPSDSPLRQGSYRGLAATANHFARESHMDELAWLINADPLEFRLRNLKNERMRDVLTAAARAFGWSSRAKRADIGSGIAVGFEKGSYIATCAEVGVETSGEVRVTRLVSAYDCGPSVNPDQLKNQVEGAMVQGLGGALFEAIEFTSGVLENGQFSKYRVPRFRDMPVLEVVLLDRKDVPAVGAGETPIVGVAPAIANAIYDAAGLRIRSMPLAPKGVRA